MTRTPRPKCITADGFHFYRDGEKWLIRGVTYGPFEHCSEGDCYPPAETLQRDFARMVECGVNVVRLYEPPQDRVAACAEKHGILMLIDIPWPKHLDVYDDKAMRRMCLEMVEAGVNQTATWGNTLGILLGNEIPADMVRWHGPEKVEQLIQEMYKRVKTIAPNMLVGFANFPSTEYLDLGFLDFVGFNIYLDNPAALREYLVRLRHLYPDKPLILSECGLDSRNSGTEAQATLLPEYICSAFESGLAGVLVFAWTDKWFTGGLDIRDWDFGLVDRQRQPKPAFEVVKQTFAAAPQCVAMDTPVSLVIATYNGARTLRQCLESIRQMSYNNFETIVVDDGSTDNTPDILMDFPEVRVISQQNRGLSAARNAGIDVATGEIVAFTDSDCMVDRDWLYFIALFLERNPQMAGVGGPNITPFEDTLTQRAIALAPGHATHVLITHIEAEHVPGCNMAFRRSALQQVGGFDPVYRKAGDDVDIIWRLQDLGYAVGFSTASFVWHHRRPTVQGYIRQQAGYGEAETLLLKKHPHRFTETGQSVWRGVIYPTHSMQSLTGTRRVQYGTFATAGYQCVYHAPPAIWFYFATSLEWWVFAAVLAMAGAISPLAFAMGITMAVVSLAVSANAVITRWPKSGTYPATAFPLLWMLWVLQPLVRGSTRYWHRLKLLRDTRITSPRKRSKDDSRLTQPVIMYWCEKPGLWRADLLQLISAEMKQRQWVSAANNEWENWDLSVVLSSWFRVRLISVEECFGEAKRLLKLRMQLVPSQLLYIVTIGFLTACLLIALYDSIIARWVLAAGLILLLLAYRYAMRGRADVWQLVDDVITGAEYWPVNGVQGNSHNVVETNALEGLAEKREV